MDMEATDLARHLRTLAEMSPYYVKGSKAVLLAAADMIEEMAQRISVAELADAEAHHAD
jgi:hypothetical protein